jgi:hypothetical protein
MRFGDWYLSKQPRQDLTSLPLQTGCGSPRLPPDTILTHASESTDSRLANRCQAAFGSVNFCLPACNCLIIRAGTAGAAKKQTAGPIAPALNVPRSSRPGVRADGRREYTCNTEYRSSHASEMWALREAATPPHDPS